MKVLAGNLKPINFLAAFLIAFVILTSCGSDTGTKEEDSTSNSPPIIDQLQIPNAPVTGGSSVELKVTAHDPDGDILKYEWAVKDGKLSGYNLPSVK